MSNKPEIISTTTLSNKFFHLKELTINVENSKGEKQKQVREVYHTANGATVLLYNNDKGTVILTRQLRISTVLNGNESGLVIEACAGLVEDETPEESIIREIEEETGYIVEAVDKIFELYSSPGATTEKLYYFIAEYDPEKKVSDGGGLDHEQEDIEVIEMKFHDAYLMVEKGEINDAKTVQLLQYARINLFTNDRVFDIL